ncbi:hypothetical protein GGX14DRAFT_632912 [Mycena pura]|uniref:Uncharacterized protein n=1 Tax=Mycena pura TaxID=153505 RepID=A0AAD6YGP8_9AGAR|nr:hypothetical protein GGX14DRAFT_632912 [Mycena pura]
MHGLDQIPVPQTSTRTGTSLFTVKKESKTIRIKEEAFTLPQDVSSKLTGPGSGPFRVAQVSACQVWRKRPALHRPFSPNGRQQPSPCGRVPQAGLESLPLEPTWRCGSDLRLAPGDHAEPSGAALWRYMGEYENRKFGSITGKQFTSQTGLQKLPHYRTGAAVVAALDREGISGSTAASSSSPIADVCPPLLAPAACSPPAPPSAFQAGVRTSGRRVGRGTQSVCLQLRHPPPDVRHPLHHSRRSPRPPPDVRRPPPAARNCVPGWRAD